MSLMQNRSKIFIGLLFFAVATFSQTDTGWISLFNGKDLTGWEGDTSIWKIKDGYILGLGNASYKTYLINRTHTFSDFELVAEVMLYDGKGNSGINYRAKDYDVNVNYPYEISGYQADMGNGYWGALYDIYTTTKTNRYRISGGGSCEKANKLRDWNLYRITAIGRVLTHELNGSSCMTFTDNDSTGLRKSGLIAIEYHSGGGFEVRIKSIKVRKISSVGIKNHGKENLVKHASTGINLKFRMQESGLQIETIQKKSNPNEVTRFNLHGKRILASLQPKTIH